MLHVPLHITKVINVSDCLVMRSRKEALCLASVTYMTRDMNDTFVTNHPDDRKPSFAGSWRNTIKPFISFRNKSHLKSVRFLHCTGENVRKYN